MNTKILVLVGVAALLLGGCEKSETAKHEEKPKLEVTQPLRKDATVTKQYVARIQAYRHIELRAMEKGYLQHIMVDEGQSVSHGQAMFKIMPNILQGELQRTKAEANAVHIEYQNTSALADKHVVSQNELALAKAKLDKANAEVSLAETRLGFTNISAPFDGIMDRLEVRNGSLVDEGDLLTTLSDISKMWVYFNVPETEYLDYAQSKKPKSPVKVQLKLANGRLFDQFGVVETVEADFDNKTGNIEFRATFPNPNRILRHGQTGNIVVAMPHPNAIIIPQKATFEILDKMYVYVVNNDGKLEQRLITVAAELPHLFIIKDGLKETDRILLEGLRKVHNGQQIDVDFRPPEKVYGDLHLHAE